MGLTNAILVWLCGAAPPRFWSVYVTVIVPPVVLLTLDGLGLIVPAVIVNPVGKGKAVLLNFSAASYPNLSLPQTSATVAEFSSPLPDRRMRVPSGVCCTALRSTFSIARRSRSASPITVPGLKRAS